MTTIPVWQGDPRVIEDRMSKRISVGSGLDAPSALRALADHIEANDLSIVSPIEIVHCTLSERAVCWVHDV